MKTPLNPSPRVRPNEMRLAREWVNARLDGDASPFSFRYGGHASSELLPRWKRHVARRRLDAKRTQLLVTYTDPATRLRVRCVAVEYRDFPVVEWMVFLKNNGRRDTPILENVQALDVELSRGVLGANPRLHYHIGSPTSPDEYRPLEEMLSPGTVKKVATSHGRPCKAHMPFFNVNGADGGLIIAVGWGGQWAATFGCGPAGNVRLGAGQELTHFTLRPGEEVRTPLIALLFHRGERIRSQNIWRRWMMAHNLPRTRGQLPRPMLCGIAYLHFAPWGISNALSMKEFIDTYAKRKLPIDAWWTDAGWYDCDKAKVQPGYSLWHYTGTWKPSPRRFPNGLREVNDHAHRNGLKAILWFDPERIMPGTWLARNRPQWLLKAPPNPGDQAYGNDMRLLNLGHPAALRWLINCIDRILTREHVDIYREDFNMDPLLFWRANDAPDRQGITEIKHVMGHLALWDELRRRHPRLLIDNVSSGCKRLELEAMRRSVTFTRSDHTPGYRLDEGDGLPIYEANQSITHGISFWAPYAGTYFAWAPTGGAERVALNTYQFRSMMCPGMGVDMDPRRADLNADLWRRCAAEFKETAPLFFGDYYPLTPYSLGDDVWMAWQFDCPERGAGMVQAFRRQNCPHTTVRLRLHGLRQEASYAVTDLDTGTTRRVTGRTLRTQGLLVSAETKPTALLFRYKRSRM